MPEGVVVAERPTEGRGVSKALAEPVTEVVRLALPGADETTARRVRLALCDAVRVGDAKADVRARVVLAVCDRLREPEREVVIDAERVRLEVAGPLGVADGVLDWDGKAEGVSPVDTDWLTEATCEPVGVAVGVAAWVPVAVKELLRVGDPV